MIVRRGPRFPLLSRTCTDNSVSPCGNPIKGETMLQNCFDPLGNPPGVSTDSLPFAFNVHGWVGLNDVNLQAQSTNASVTA